MTSMMKPFPESTLEHLGAYRRDVLHIPEPGIFQHRGSDIPKDHILPEAQKVLNILPLLRGDSRSFDDLKLKCAGSNRPIQWHRFAHHLNSSQVLTVNLFQPLLSPLGDNGDTLARVFGLAEPCHLSFTGFEWEPDDQEKTNIDFVITGGDGCRILMEFKLTEREFGKATDDEKHRSKFNAVYQDRLFEKLHLPAGQEWDTFRQHYQLFRNILLADARHRCRVWFVLPARHKRLWDLANEAMTFVAPKIRHLIEIKKLSEVLNAIEMETGHNEALRQHYAEFRQKYEPALIDPML